MQDIVVRRLRDVGNDTRNIACRVLESMGRHMLRWEDGRTVFRDVTNRIYKLDFPMQVIFPRIEDQQAATNIARKWWDLRNVEEELRSIALPGVRIRRLYATDIRSEDAHIQRICVNLGNLRFGESAVMTIWLKRRIAPLGSITIPLWGWGFGPQLAVHVHDCAESKASLKRFFRDLARSSCHEIPFA